jgi:hypothetical protein
MSVGRDVKVEQRFVGMVNTIDCRGLAADLRESTGEPDRGSGSSRSRFAAKAATTTIPIVFRSQSARIRSRLVSSRALYRPGLANITGITFNRRDRLGGGEGDLSLARRAYSPNGVLNAPLLTHPGSPDGIGGIA